jgi:hypothetical protein
MDAAMYSLANYLSTSPSRAHHYRRAGDQEGLEIAGETALLEFLEYEEGARPASRRVGDFLKKSLGTL